MSTAKSEAILHQLLLKGSIFEWQRAAIKLALELAYQEGRLDCATEIHAETQAIMALAPPPSRP